MLFASNAFASGPQAWSAAKQDFGPTGSENPRRGCELDKGKELRRSDDFNWLDFFLIFRVI
jgi:hypothetical protein